MESLLQTEWPELEVFVTSVTEQWTAAAIVRAGGRAPVLANIADIDVSNAAFPFLAVGACHLRTALGPVPARLFRMSYSGELAYEIHVPADKGRAMWNAVLAAGADYGIMPYGTEAMGTLRIEKGHIVVGAEADGRTTAHDLGLGGLASRAKSCIGGRLSERPALESSDRWQLVGLVTLGDAPIPRAAKIVADPDRAAAATRCSGTSRRGAAARISTHGSRSRSSPSGRARHGQTLWAVSPLANVRVQVQVGPPCFIDPKGERLRG